MKVRELLEKLSKLDSELEVVCFSEDNGSVCFDITSVSAAKVEKLRLEDGNPCLSFKMDELPESVAILEVTADF